MISRRHLAVIKEIVKRLEGKDITWMIGGSSNLALQGVDVAEHDIDISTDKDGAYAIEEALAEFLTVPVEYSESEQFRSHFGKFEMDGIEIEVMGELEILDKKIDRWVHLSDSDFATTIEVEGSTIPVVELSHETKMYQIRGDTEKMHAIVNHLIEKYR